MEKTQSFEDYMHELEERDRKRAISKKRRAPKAQGTSDSSSADKSKTETPESNFRKRKLDDSEIKKFERTCEPDGHKNKFRKLSKKDSEYLIRNLKRI